MRVARITIDLMRAVPMRPLRAVSRAVRTGRRIQVVDATLSDGDRDVARASALRVRLDERVGAEAHEEHGWEPPPVGSRPGDHAGISAQVLQLAPGFLRAIDFERGNGPDGSGSVVAWTRLRCAIVAGEESTPLVRLAASADFTSGTASRLDFTRWLFINPDLSIHVERDPAGEWIAVEAQSTIALHGGGQSSAILHDLQGPVARTQASMLVDRRGGDGG
jgi:hypothetical protein